jgi:hypothetical protein
MVNPVPAAFAHEISSEQRRRASLDDVMMALPDLARDDASRHLRDVFGTR